MDGRPRDASVPAAALRVRLTKTGRARYMSHLDFVRTVERSARRAGLPMALTSGFRPRPRVSFSPALPVGTSSLCEFVDILLRENLAAHDAASRLARCLPDGIAVVSSSVLSPDVPALAGVIQAASYRVSFRRREIGDPDEVVRASERVLDARSLPIMRTTPKGRRAVDLRPLIYDICVEPREGIVSLYMVVAASSKGNARPLEVVEAMREPGGLSSNARPVEIIREGLYVRRDGRLCLPS